jgi:biopolymer transport protein ExbD
MRIPAMVRHKSTDWVLQFINIVFLLLLYFLVNGTIAESIRPDIALPVSLSDVPGSPPHDAVYVNADGSFSFRGKVAAPDTITAAFGKGKPATVVADKSLNARKLVSQLELLRKAGIGQLTLLTMNRTGR